MNSVLRVYLLFMLNTPLKIELSNLLITVKLFLYVVPNSQEYHVSVLYILVLMIIHMLLIITYFPRSAPVSQTYNFTMFGANYTDFMSNATLVAMAKNETCDLVCQSVNISLSICGDQCDTEFYAGSVVSSTTIDFNGTSEFIHEF